MNHDFNETVKSKSAFERRKQHFKFIRKKKK